MRLFWNSRDFLNRIGRSHGQDGFHGPQAGEGPVIIARPEADPVAAPVKGRQRHEDDVGQHFSNFGIGDWNTWVYGSAVCRATSVDNEDLAKLNRLFETLWAHVCD